MRVENTSQFSYNEDNNEGYFLESIQNDLHFLPEGVKIGKVEKPLANLHNKIERVVHVRN